MELQTQSGPVDQLLADAGQYQQQGDFQQAIACYQQALQAEPTNTEIYNALGLTMLRLGENPMATQLFQTATSLNPESASSFRNLGLSLFAQDEKPMAIKALETSLQLDRHNIDALLNIGQIHSYSGNFDKARNYLERAHKEDKSLSQPLEELAEVSLKQKRYREAIKLAREALAIHPHHGCIKALHALAVAHRFLSNPGQAVKHAMQLVKLQPDVSDYRVELVKSLLTLGGMNDGLQQAEKAIELDPENAAAYSCLSLVLSRRGRWHEALDSMDQALELEPENEEYLGQKAGVLHRLGRNSEAYEIALPLISNRKNFKSNILQIFAQIAKDYGKQEEAAKLLEDVLLNNKLPDAVRSELSFSAGQIFDKLKQYDKAFKYYRTGNKLRHVRFNYERESNKFKGFKDIFNAEFLQHIPQATVKTERPIFIIGMPRSGTSLTEKILASHSQVFGANELTEIRDICRDLPGIIGTQTEFPSCARELTEQSINQAAQRYLDFIDTLDEEKHARITDKMPQNFAYLGLIATMFPDAPIIHCNRNPMDTGLSCYFQNFANATSGMAFTYDLTSLGNYYRLYLDMMQHWNQVLPGRIYDIHYESLVSNPRTEIEKLLEHCGLDWEEACMEHNKSSHMTTTASYDQVRQPINTRSVERWRHYRKQLAPLKKALQIR